MAVKSSDAPRARPARQSAFPGDRTFYRGDEYKFEESIGYLLRRLRTELDRAIETEMAGLDLTSVQWGPLFAIANGLADNAAQLSRLVRIDSGAMTRLLDRLETKGLLRRVACPTDARVSRLELTAEGRQVCRDIPFALSRVLNRSLRGFTEAELETFKSMARRMLVNVEAG